MAIETPNVHLRGGGGGYCVTRGVCPNPQLPTLLGPLYRGLGWGGKTPNGGPGGGGEGQSDGHYQCLELMLKGIAETVEYAFLEHVFPSFYASLNLFQ